MAGKGKHTTAILILTDGGTKESGNDVQGSRALRLLRIVVKKIAGNLQDKDSRDRGYQV